MKIKNLLVGAVAALAAFASCQEPEQNLGTPDISISTSEMTFDAEGGDKELSVNATRDWKVQTDADWVVVSPESGSASAEDQTVTVSVLENTGMDRSADLKFTIGMKSKYLTVSQAGPGGSPEALIVYSNDFDKEEATKTYGSSGSSWPYLDQFEGWKNQKGTGAENVTYTFQGMSARANSTSDGTHSDYAGSGKNNMFFGSAAYLSTNGIALGGATDFTLTFGTEKYSQDTAVGSIFTKSEFRIYLSKDGSKWVELTDYSFAGDGTEGRWNIASADFSVPEGTETLSICMQVSVASVYRVDDMKLVISAGGAAIDFSKAVEMDFAAGNAGGNPGGGDSDASAIYSNNYDKSAAVQGSNGWPFLDSSDAWKNAAGTGAANVTYASKNATVRNNSNSNGSYSDYAGSGMNNIFFGKDYPYFATKNIALNGATGLTLKFGTEKYSQDYGSTFTNSEYHIFLSNDGAKWVELTDYTFAGTADGRWNVATANFTVPAGTENLSICMQVDVASAYRLDDMKLVASEGGVAVDFTAAVEKDFNAGATDGGNTGGGDLPVEGQPTNLVKATIAEFLASAEDDTWYELTGEIINIAKTDYGNFTIKDATGEVYIYGMTSKWVGSNDKSFSQIGLKVGDTVTLGSKRTSYQGTPQGGGNPVPAFYISHVPGEGTEEPVTPPVTGEGMWSYTFASGDLGSSNVTLNGLQWTFVMNDSDYLGFDNSNGRGLQMGKKADPASSILLSTEGIEGTITKIVVNSAGASGTDAVLSVKVGDSQFGSSKNMTTSPTDYTFEGQASGKIEIGWTVTTAAVYIKSITIYSE